MERQSNHRITLCASRRHKSDTSDGACWPSLRLIERLRGVPAASLASQPRGLLQ